MSNAALGWAFALPIRGSGKHVLIALANHADANGVCYPSQALLALETGLSERSVRAGLDALERGDLIQSQRQHGRLSSYVLAIGSIAKPEPEPEGSSYLEETGTGTGTGSSFPFNRKVVPLKPEASSDKPSRTIIQPKENHSEVAHARATQKIRGGRLPDDWQPGPTEIAYAESKGLAPVAIAEAFRDHWHASALPSAMKVNWSAAWRTWCRREIGNKPTSQVPFKNGFLEIIRQQRAGTLAPEPDNPVTAFLRLPNVH